MSLKLTAAGWDLRSRQGRAWLGGLAVLAVGGAVAAALGLDVVAIFLLVALLVCSMTGAILGARRQGRAEGR